MNKLKKSLLNLSLAGILGISGCSGMTLGGYTPSNFCNTELAPSIKKQADKYSESENMEDRVKAFKSYGSIGMLEEAKEQWEWINEKDSEKGLLYGDTYLKFKKLHKK